MTFLVIIKNNLVHFCVLFMKQHMVKGQSSYIGLYFFLQVLHLLPQGAYILPGYAIIICISYLTSWKELLTMSERVSSRVRESIIPGARK